MARFLAEAFAPKLTTASILAAVREFFPDAPELVQIVEYQRPHTADMATWILDDPNEAPDPELVFAAGDAPVDAESAVLDTNTVKDGRFDGFNEELGLLPYQFAIIVPGVDRFDACFVFDDSSVTAINARLAGFCKNAPGQSQNNNVLRSTPGFRRANASQELKRVVREFKAAGTMPIFRPAGGIPPELRGKIA